jgi:hypothetical protein
VTVEYHWLEGNYDRLPTLLADLVHRQVAAIATPGSDPAPINPITGSFDCCARAVSGHASDAPPSADMNCRLPIPIAIRPVPDGIAMQTTDPLT